MPCCPWRTMDISKLCKFILDVYTELYLRHILASQGLHCMIQAPSLRPWQIRSTFVITMLRHLLEDKSCAQSDIIMIDQWQH